MEAAYDWVFRAAAILANVAGAAGATVKAQSRGLLGAMARHAERAGNLSGARSIPTAPVPWSGISLLTTARR